MREVENLTGHLVKFQKDRPLELLTCGVSEFLAKLENRTTTSAVLNVATKAERLLLVVYHSTSSVKWDIVSHRFVFFSPEEQKYFFLWTTRSDFEVVA